MVNKRCIECSRQFFLYFTFCFSIFFPFFLSFSFSFLSAFAYVDSSFHFHSVFYHYSFITLVLFFSVHPSVHLSLNLSVILSIYLSISLCMFVSIFYKHSTTHRGSLQNSTVTSYHISLPRSHFPLPALPLLATNIPLE